MTHLLGRNGRSATLRESMEEVWLAGRGALAIAEEEGSKFFHSLVKRGEGFETTRKAQSRHAVSSARSVARRTPVKEIQGIEERFGKA